MMERIKQAIALIENEEIEMIQQLSQLYQQVKGNNAQKAAAPVIKSGLPAIPGDLSQPTAEDGLSPPSSAPPTPTHVITPLSTSRFGSNPIGTNSDSLQTQMNNFNEKLETNSELLQTRLHALTSLLTSVPGSTGTSGSNQKNFQDDFNAETLAQADPTTFLSSLMLTQDYYPGCSTLATQLQMIDDFIPEQERFMMTGYYLATTQAAMELLLTHEPNQVHADEDY